MNEFELIARLIPLLPVDESVVAGAGDDCAVVDMGIPDRLVLLKTDAVVEGVHFGRETEPERIGRKALARCLSDIAAMAGTPAHALVTLGLPPGFDVAMVEGMYRGLTDLARRHGVSVVGGETTRSPERIFLSVALTGWVPRNSIIRRGGAKPGDAIFVSGTLGGSILGKHLDFEPRLEEARWLAANFPLHAMMDVSDGLAGDLRHLLNAGGVGAEILASAIPVSRAARQAILDKLGLAGASDVPIDLRRRALLAALTDGEDFELLFTLPGRMAVPLLDAWKARFPEVKLSCVGKVTEGGGLRIRERDGLRPLTAHGYTHFA